MGIVTDTNILYHIADGLYPIERIKQLPLIVTASNIVELISSPKIQTEEGHRQVINVCNTIRRFNPKYQLQLPYDFVAREYFGKKLKGKILLRAFYDVCDYGIGDEQRNESVKMRKARVTDFKASMIEQIKNVKLSPEIVSKLSEANTAADSSATDFALELQKVTGVNPRSADKARIQRKGKGMDLYIRARAKYNQNLTLKKGYLPAGNDQLDLANLMYVRNEDLYWTTDEKWLNIINDVNMGHKLFNL